MAGMKARRVGGWFNTIVGSLLMLGLWGLVAIVAARPEAKALWDVSPQQTSSVSEETKQLIRLLREQELSAEVHTFYFDYARQPVATPEQQHQNGLKLSVRRLTIDLLKRYASLGGSSFRVIDHSEYLGNEAFREATSRFNLNSRELDAIVVKLGDRFEKLDLRTDLAEYSRPRMAPTNGPQQAQLVQLRAYRGEQAITSALKGLMLQGKPKAYFLEGYHHEGGLLNEIRTHGYSFLRRGLVTDGFDVRQFNFLGAVEVPEDADLVVLMEPTRELPAQHAEALGEWVRGGGRLLVNAAFTPGGVERNPTLASLGSRLGFQVEQARLLHAVPRNTGVRGGVDFGPRCNIMQVAASPDHPVTRALFANKVALRAEGARSIREVEIPRGITPVSPMLATGPYGYVVPMDPGSGGRQRWAPPDRTDPRNFSQKALSRTFLARPVDIGGGAEDEDVEPGKVVVLGGKLFHNGYWNQGGRDLALNLFNYLAKRQELVTIRKDPYEARILQIEDRQVRNIRSLHFGIVGVMALGGLVVFLSRRRI